MISYKDKIMCRKLTDYGQKSSPKRQDMTEIKKMADELNWDTALDSGSYVKFEEGKRKTVVGKNVRFSKVEKEFKGQAKAEYQQLTMDVVEEDGQECEKEMNTLSKRFIAGLRPLFEKVAADVEVRFSVKKIGSKTDTAWDVEKL